jgi:hypothetical protein
MSCQIQHYNFDETTEGLPHMPTPSRIARLQNLICAGHWSAKNDIVMLYWENDAAKPGGGHWVAWEGPDPLPPSEITVA